MTKSINLNKNKPKAIKDYWGKVFNSCGLIGSEIDVEVLDKIKSFKVDLIDASIQHIKIVFEFDDNDFI